MPAEIENDQDMEVDGPSTSSAISAAKQDKKKNIPWIEKFRPQVFEEIMGKIKIQNKSYIKYSLNPKYIFQAMKKPFHVYQCLQHKEILRI